MIYKVYANDSRFKMVQFEKGLNIILAERENSSGNKDSRNGVGKTTLLHVIDFCLGSNSKRMFFPINEISEWSFFMELDLFGSRVTIERKICNDSEIIVEGDLTKFPFKPEKNEKKAYLFYKLSDWNLLLGQYFFSLNRNEHLKYKPSFRSLISYFIRLGTSAYDTPFEWFKNSKAWNIQMCTAYLLGLDWAIISEIEELKDKNNSLVALETAVKAGATKTKGEFEAEKVRLKGELEIDEQTVQNFQVMPKYAELQNKSDELTTIIHDTSNSIIMLKKKLKNYNNSIKFEATKDIAKVSQVFEEAGVCFADSLKKTLEEAITFHEKIVENRKVFLNAEIISVQNKIIEFEHLLNEKIKERANLMKILESHGALEEFNLLQNGVIEKKELLRKTESIINDLNNMSEKKATYKRERLEINARLSRNYEELRTQWESVVHDFNEYSQILYNSPGNLIIDISDKGQIKEKAYRFNVSIPKGKSDGVSKMKIYCYDLALVKSYSQKGLLNFLIHDSLLYDSVDSRQRALALENAHQQGLKNEFQYICTFNSDMVPYDEFSKDFSFDGCVKLKLSDKDPKDSLFGFHFEI